MHGCIKTKITVDAKTYLHDAILFGSRTVKQEHSYCSRPLPSILAGTATNRRRWLLKVKQSSAELTKDGTRQTLVTIFLSSQGPASVFNHFLADNRWIGGVHSRAGLPAVTW